MVGSQISEKEVIDWYVAVQDTLINLIGWLALAVLLVGALAAGFIWLFPTDRHDRN